MLEQIFESLIGRIVISVILGFGLAAMFKKVCKGQSCVLFQSPDLKELDKYYYKIENDCFKYTPYVTACEAPSTAPAPASAL